MPSRRHPARRAAVLAAGLLAAPVGACSPPAPGSAVPPPGRTTGAASATTEGAAGTGWTARALSGGIVARWSGQGLQVSRDDGTTYVDVPPPPTAMSSVRDVAATTSQVAVASVVDGRPAVWLTDDAGPDRSPVVLVPPQGAPTDSVGDVQLDVADGRLSGLASRLSTSSSFAAGQSYAAPSRDDGSWSGRSAPGIGSMVPVDGRLWGVVGPTASGLARSGDGGRTWSPVDLRGCPADDGSLTVLGRSDQDQVVVAVTAGRGRTTQVVLCTSTDGRAWTPSSSVALLTAVGAGVALPGTMAGPDAVLLDPDGSRAVVSPVGGPPRVVLTHGLPSGVTSVSAADADHLVALVVVSGCGSTGKVSCGSWPASYVTTDGGRTWHLLAG